jgi:RNA polymerase sigma factor (sigma-70 family)
MNTHTLLLRIEEGNTARQKAVEELYEYLKKYRFYGKKYLDSCTPEINEVCSDLFQESFMALLDNIFSDKFRKEACITTYFYSILRNKARVFRMMQSHQSGNSLDDIPEEFIIHTHESSNVEHDLESILKEHLPKLEVPAQEMLHLILTDGMNDEEVGRRMRIFDLKLTRRLKKKYLDLLRHTVHNQLALH